MSSPSRWLLCLSLLLGLGACGGVGDRDGYTSLNQTCRKVDREQVGTCVNRCSSCSGSH